MEEGRCVSLTPAPPRRRIMIYGVDGGVFQTFLRFLYGAVLEPDSMALEELVDLLAVADRWVGSGCHGDDGATVVYVWMVYLPLKV